MDGEIICLETWKREKEEKQLEELTSLQEEISSLINEIPVEPPSLYMSEDMTVSLTDLPYSTWETPYGMSIDEIYAPCVMIDSCPSCGRKYENEEE